MAFEFMYGDSWYKYENGWIHRQNIIETWDPFCPVFHELDDQLKGFSADQLRTVMGAIIHGYSHGKVNGKKEKITEFKRVFNLD